MFGGNLKQDRGVFRLPVNIYFLTALSGPVVLLPYLSGRMGFSVWAMIIAGCLAPPLTAFFFPMSWLLIFPLTALYNIVFTAILLKKSRFERAAFRSAAWPEWMRNASALALLSIPMAIVFAGAERWMTDWLWSSLYEINFSFGSILQEYSWQYYHFILLMLVLAFFTGRLPERWTLEKLVAVLCLAALASLVVRQVFMGLVRIPQRHSLVASIYPEWVSGLREQVFLVIYLFGISMLIHHTLLKKSANQKVAFFFIRSLASLCLAVVGFAFLTGMPANYAFIGGRQFEKYARIQAAVSWYSKTFTWAYSEQFKSYLQFHVGLLMRKKGDIKGARDAFTRVLLKYNKNPTVVMKAKRFQRKLAVVDSAEGRRVVIPGVEARTEYKAAYCVPNSLGLVLNYWGDRIGAKSIGASITRLDFGSYLPDAVFFAESRGMLSFILPLQDRQSIKKLIDNRIPVLAFIPGHVLAVFGYDEVLQTYITYDVATAEIWEEIGWEEFDVEWNKTFNLLLAVVPPEKATDVETFLGSQTTKISDYYMQYLLYLHSRESPLERVKHLAQASGQKLFFVDWALGLVSGNAVPPSLPDSSVQRYLMKNGISQMSILGYLNDLALRRQFDQGVVFLEDYRKRNSLDADVNAALAGFYYKAGGTRPACFHLLNTGNFQELPPYLVEFMINGNCISGRQPLAHQLSMRLLAANPFELIRGGSARRAYDIRHSVTGQNQQYLNESLELAYQYLINWDPFEPEIVQDLENVLTVKKFNDDEEWERSVWQERLSASSANASVFISSPDNSR